MIACRAGRIIRPELLDHAPPEEARRNLREIVFLNRYFGGHEVLRKSLTAVASPGEAFTFLDIGAASGDMAQAAAKSFPLMRPINVDLHALHLERASGERAVADAFRLPFRDGAIDIAHCSLFLHHFTNDQVVDLLREMNRVARRAVVVQDLERHPLAYYFVPATRWLFGWSAIVRHDAPVSVEAAFEREELAALAAAAGLSKARVLRHRPAFRLSLVARR